MLYKILNVLSKRDSEFEQLALDYAKLVMPICESLYKIRSGDDQLTFDDDKKVKQRVKRFKDTLYSKISELHAQRHCASLTDVKIISQVDLNIYAAESKTWSADFYLKYKDGIIGVGHKNTCTQYGGDLFDLNEIFLGFSKKQLSWTIQYEDELYKPETIQEHRHISFFTHYLPNGDVMLKAWVDNCIIKKMFVLPFHVYKWPKLKNGKMSGKKCIMYESCYTKQGFPCGILELPQRLKK